MPTLTLAKQHIKVEGTSEDALIGQYVAATSAWVENFTGKLLTRRQVTQEERTFGDYLDLVWGPAPTTLTIAYADTAGQPQTLTTARLFSGRVYAPLAGWPAPGEYLPITLTYTAGYQTVPADLDAAVLLLVGEYYKNREAGTASSALMTSVENLCGPYRAVRV